MSKLLELVEQFGNDRDRCDNIKAVAHFDEIAQQIATLEKKKKKGAGAGVAAGET